MSSLAAASWFQGSRRSVSTRWREVVPTFFVPVGSGREGLALSAWEGRRAG
ncbi:hypothetical protein [Nonomuraea recticatena]|uniref:hypothetical protein n=1 Tax=Nonomuraea recticatena TaxID=46178 RepID=UPI00361E4B1E